MSSFFSVTFEMYFVYGTTHFIVDCVRNLLGFLFFFVCVKRFNPEAIKNTPNTAANECPSISDLSKKPLVNRLARKLHNRTKINRVQYFIINCEHLSKDHSSFFILKIKVKL